ncbi:hypothetical protein WJX84_010491 [Apatococcus fuscideae]|uniref:Uncharacterized protein n=1 Tax=Apatococcus fuscideae TaxID=2026836 RepID=A0AAW1TGF3_9CHLO
MDHETSEKEAVGSGSTSDKFPVWQHAGRPMQTKAVERLRSCLTEIGSAKIPDAETTCLAFDATENHVPLAWVLHEVMHCCKAASQIQYLKSNHGPAKLLWRTLEQLGSHDAGTLPLEKRASFSQLIARLLINVSQRGLPPRPRPRTMQQAEELCREEGKNTQPVHPELRQIILKRQVLLMQILLWRIEAATVQQAWLLVAGNACACGHGDNISADGNVDHILAFTRTAVSALVSRLDRQGLKGAWREDDSASSCLAESCILGAETINTAVQSINAGDFGEDQQYKDEDALADRVGVLAEAAARGLLQLQALPVLLLDSTDPPVILELLLDSQQIRHAFQKLIIAKILRAKPLQEASDLLVFGHKLLGNMLAAVHSRGVEDLGHCEVVMKALVCKDGPYWNDEQLVVEVTQLLSLLEGKDTAVRRIKLECEQQAEAAKKKKEAAREAERDAARQAGEEIARKAEARSQEAGRGDQLEIEETAITVLTLPCGSECRRASKAQSSVEDNTASGHESDPGNTGEHGRRESRVDHWAPAGSADAAWGDESQPPDGGAEPLNERSASLGASTAAICKAEQKPDRQALMLQLHNLQRSQLDGFSQSYISKGPRQASNGQGAGVKRTSGVESHPVFDSGAKQAGQQPPASLRKDVEARDICLPRQDDTSLAHRTCSGPEDGVVSTSRAMGSPQHSSDTQQQGTAPASSMAQRPQMPDHGWSRNGAGPFRNWL